MRERRDEDPSRFAWWVALASLAFTLALFFSNTVPALREQQSLREVQVELGDLRSRYEAAIREVAQGIGTNGNYDLQALLVAIDQQGYTPLELAAAYPTPAASPAR